MLMKNNLKHGLLSVVDLVSVENRVMLESRFRTGCERCKGMRAFFVGS